MREAFEGRIVALTRRSAALSARARQLTPEAPEREVCLAGTQAARAPEADRRHGGGDPWPVSACRFRELPAAASRAGPAQRSRARGHQPRRVQEQLPGPRVERLAPAPRSRSAASSASAGATSRDALRVRFSGGTEVRPKAKSKRWLDVRVPSTARTGRPVIIGRYGMRSRPSPTILRVAVPAGPEPDFLLRQLRDAASARLHRELAVLGGALLRASPGRRPGHLQRHVHQGDRRGHGHDGRLDRRLRQLHLHPPHLEHELVLRAPERDRRLRRRPRVARPGHRARRLHRQLHRPPPALRDPHQRLRRAAPLRGSARARPGGARPERPATAPARSARAPRRAARRSSRAR